MLEASQYDDNTFATLTYADNAMPENNSVTPRELSLFIKRLRKNYPVKFRYFGVGEYGDTTERPHYHVALFGVRSCDYGITRKRTYCCASCDRVAKAWGKGQILLGTLEAKSAAYIAGYVTKKMTRPDDTRLKGKAPEFARMSLRPGIGLGMMHELASVLMEHKLDERMIDVPLSLQHGMAKWPLGRYLRRKLRTFIGREANAPEAALLEQTKELQDLRKSAFETSTPLKNAVLDASLGRRIQLNNRERLYKKRNSL